MLAPVYARLPLATLRALVERGVAVDPAGLTGPWLWVAHRRKVALGAALGVGFGVFPGPGQMGLAAVAAIICACAAVRMGVGAMALANWVDSKDSA